MRVMLTLIVGACFLSAQIPEAPKRKRILAIGQSKGFQHDSMPEGQATIWKLGKETGLWETFLRTDTELITKKNLGSNGKNLDSFDAVFFFTSGELDLDEEQKTALLDFIRQDGKGLMAAHSGVAEYGELVGGYFDVHP